MHQAMRGPSEWSVGDRELMAAVVAQAAGGEFCTRAHCAVATRAYGDEARVKATLAALDSAPIEEPLRATLRVLGKVTRGDGVEPEDLKAALAAGATRRQLEEALDVAFAFNTLSRLADAFRFDVGDQRTFEAGARFLLARGYR
jgi:AhpD family alkylhydroperoxidase